jgi:hypothetical protein
MSRFTIRNDGERSAHILHITNYLVASQIMTFTDTVSLTRKWYQDKIVKIDIPDEASSGFCRFLDEVMKCQYEIAYE